MPTWILIDGKHLVPSNIGSLQHKTVFVSHAICCDRPQGGTRQAYRMHTLRGTQAMQANTIRASMCASKIEMLEEIMRHPHLPEYLGNPCRSIDITTPIRQTIADIRRYPCASPPATHIIGG